MRKFFRRSPAEQWLLLKTLLLVAAIRTGLFVIPYRTLRRILARIMRRRPVDRRSRASIELIASCVGTASRYVPRATCLTQALAAQLLMPAGDIGRSSASALRATAGGRSTRTHGWSMKGAS